MPLNQKTKILLWSSNIWYLGEGMLGPFFAVFAQRIGGDILDITWAWALYLFVTGGLTLLVGRISDRVVSAEKIMIAGYVLNTLFTFSYLLISSPWHLLVVQAGLGVASAMVVPTWSALYAHSEEKERAAYVWGLASGQFELVTGVAVVLGGIIVNYFSFTALFVVMGLIQIVATIYQARIFKFV